MKTGSGALTTTPTVAAHEGWQELLPAGARRRALCLDVGDGQATLALAATYEEVVSVPLIAADVTSLAEVVASAGAPQVTVVPTLQRLPLGEFDGLIAVLFGASRTGVGPDDLWSLVRQAAERVGDGYVLLGAANALAYSRHSDPVAGKFCTWGARGLERIAVASGRDDGRSWPVLLDDGVPFELLHGPYRSSVGARGTERIKELFLGPAGARWFAPGYVTLGQRQASPLVLDELLESVDAVCGGESRLRRHLAKPDKTILVTDIKGEDGGRVVVLPHTSRALSLRSNEAEVLRRARTLPPHLRDLFPVSLGEGQHEGQHWLVLDRMRGSFVDEPVADLDQITARAAAVLVELHRETRREVRVDDSVYGSLVGCLIASAQRRHPWCAETLARIDLRLRTELLGHVMPQVLMHGDYKIENVAFDRDTRGLVGIIDWELAKLRGLPLIDLKYLLVYNRMIRDRRAFEVVFREVADGTRWSEGEMRLLDEYATAIGLDEDLRRVLQVLFVVHTVAARFQYDGTNAAGRERLSGLLRLAGALLERRDQCEVEGA